jgi:hypothetical protein
VEGWLRKKYIKKEKYSIPQPQNFFFVIERPKK